MAAVAAQTPVNGDGSSQVDLSTIPISPEGSSNANENTKPGADGEQITVFHDKDNFNVKHPLMHKWTLWFTKPPSGKVILPACQACWESTLI
jgi:translation initiation factor 4E